jgi:glutathione S-transferase
MAPFKLYGAPLSTCTRKVAMIAIERNIPYEVVVVDLMAGEHKQPAFLEHQPFAQVPYIVVRHFPLSASTPLPHSYTIFFSAELAR